MKRSGLYCVSTRQMDHDLFGFGEVLGVIMQGPEIHHDDGVFGDEHAFVPIVLSDIVVLT